MGNRDKVAMLLTQRCFSLEEGLKMTASPLRQTGYNVGEATSRWGQWRRKRE